MFKKAVVIGALALMSGAAFCQTATPRIDQRQENQERRIENGEQSGALTPRETRTLDAREAKIEADKNAAKADGTVTQAERAKLRGETRRTSRAIYRKKHNRRVAPAGG
jgi:uncharacterized membrane protein YebE (DUF533 family)